jgi:hypothetical protein
MLKKYISNPGRGTHALFFTKNLGRPSWPLGLLFKVFVLQCASYRFKQVPEISPSTSRMCQEPDCKRLGKPHQQCVLLCPGKKMCLACLVHEVTLSAANCVGARPCWALWHGNKTLNNYWLQFHRLKLNFKSIWFAFCKTSVCH